MARNMLGEYPQVAGWARPAMITSEWVPPSRAQRTNSLAIAALVCGIVFPAGIVAIILGHMALRQIRRTGEDGYGLARAGLILGYIGLVLLLIGFIFAALLGAGGPAAPGRSHLVSG